MNFNSTSPMNLRSKSEFNLSTIFASSEKIIRKRGKYLYETYNDKSITKINILYEQSPYEFHFEVKNGKKEKTRV